MRALLFAGLLCAGCAKPAAVESEERPATAQPSEDAVGVGTLYEAYLDDAAGAERKYGKRPLVKFGVDSVRKVGSGFVVERSTDDFVKHRIYFPESAAQQLEGAKGKVLTARCRVEHSSGFGLVLRAE